MTKNSRIEASGPGPRPILPHILHAYDLFSVGQDREGEGGHAQVFALSPLETRHERTVQAGRYMYTPVSGKRRKEGAT